MGIENIKEKLTNLTNKFRNPFDVNDPDAKVVNEENFKRNKSFGEKLHAALGGSPDSIPEFDLRDNQNVKPMSSRFKPTSVDADTGRVKGILQGSNKVSDFNDAILAHELAHSTSPIVNSKRFGKYFNVLNLIYNSPQYRMLAPALMNKGGLLGHAITALPEIARVSEETLANIRAGKALKDINGKLTAQNLKALAISEGSYLGGVAANHILGPKLSRFGDKQQKKLLEKVLRHIR